MKQQVIFEEIKKVNEHNFEYWSARQLAKVLEYKDYRNFESVLKKAKEACINSSQPEIDHFGEVTEMVELGSNALRKIKDVHLSRYACYLVMQNADPAKEIVAMGQTYFAIQTRKQELQDQLVEDQKRLFLRWEVTTHNRHLAETAAKAGVKTTPLLLTMATWGCMVGGK